MHGYHHGECCDSGGRGRHGGFGPHGFKGPFGIAGHLHGFAGGGRARRGDVRSAILRLLAEQPMHGYQIIQELSSRSGGAWSPSAGSIYPALQLLADEGLVTAEEAAGKRVFQIGKGGSKEQVTAAIDVLNDARKKLYALLAED